MTYVSFLNLKREKLNHAKNIKYNEDVSRYIYLRNKKEKEEEEENQMMSLKENIDRVNREVLFNMLRCTEFYGNSNYMILNNQKKHRNDFIVSIKDKHGKSVFKEEGKRQVIRDYCSELFSSIATNSGAINNFLSEVKPLDSVIYETLLGKIKKEQVVSVINQLSTEKTPGLDGLL